MRRLKVILFSLVMFATAAKAQVAAVNTDIAMDALATPSLGLEFTVGNHTTVAINGMGNYKPYLMKDMKILHLQPEMRYYFSRRPMHKQFLGICAVGASYDINFKGKTYDGYGAGVGATLGYVMKVSKRFNLDFHAGVCAFFYRQKEYFDGDRYEQHYTQNGMVIPDARGCYILPTRIGVSLSYIFK